MAKEEEAAAAIVATTAAHESKLESARQAWQTVQADQQAQVISLAAKLETTAAELAAEQAAHANTTADLASRW